MPELYVVDCYSPDSLAEVLQTSTPELLLKSPMNHERAHFGCAKLSSKLSMEFAWLFNLFRQILIISHFEKKIFLSGKSFIRQSRLLNLDPVSDSKVFAGFERMPTLHCRVC